MSNVFTHVHVPVSNHVQMYKSSSPVLRLTQDEAELIFLKRKDSQAHFSYLELINVLGAHFKSVISYRLGHSSDTADPSHLLFQ